jgi:CubicO group peptidase (beta-lactamase class C family)
MPIRAVAALLLVLAAAAHAAPPLPPQPAGVPWPTLGWTTGTPQAEHTALETAVARLLLAAGPSGLPDTRALLAVQGGRIVLERYAAGFGPESRFRSWSAAKSVTQCLVGILVREGRLSLAASAPVPEWQERPGDARAAITLRSLLTMTSGLDNADGGDDADSLVAQLFFGEYAADTAHASADVDLTHPPETHWEYSTATTQILSGIVGRTVGGGREGVRAFAEQALLAPLGIRSLVLEFDAAGTMLGGGYVWASARDWARLGLLYLRDGRWDGRRVLPEGWVDFTRTAAPAANNGTYGAHFWISAKPGKQQWEVLDPSLEAFFMSGNAGQYVVMVPARDLVVVRLGEMHATTWPELHAHVSALIRAFPVTGP